MSDKYKSEVDDSDTEEVDEMNNVDNDSDADRDIDVEDQLTLISKYYVRDS